VAYTQGLIGSYGGGGKMNDENGEKQKDVKMINVSNVIIRLNCYALSDAFSSSVYIHIQEIVHES
jgi:hypothetical protein